MTQDTPAFETSHPPEAVLKVLNPVLRALLRTPLGRRMGTLLVLGFTGRKTGRRYEIPLTAHRMRDGLYVLTGAPWRHNFDGGRDVEVTVEGCTAPMRAVSLADSGQIADVYARRIAELGVKNAQRQMGIRINVPRTPTGEEVAEVVSREHLAAIRLEPRP